MYNPKSIGLSVSIELSHGRGADFALGSDGAAAPVAVFVAMASPWPADLSNGYTGFSSCRGRWVYDNGKMGGTTLETSHCEAT